MNRTLLAEVIRTHRALQHSPGCVRQPFSTAQLEDALLTLAIDVAALARAAARVLDQWQPTTREGCDIADQLDDALNTPPVRAAREDL